jgi:hypothetical protein
MISGMAVRKKLRASSRKASSSGVKLRSMFLPLSRLSVLMTLSSRDAV